MTTIPAVTDVIIIGAGTAGLAAVKQVQKQTDRYLLINSGPYGTTCARVGCMPSKLLIEAANAYHRRHSFEAFGICHAENLTVDLPAVLSRVRELRDYYVAGVLKSVHELGSKVVSASFQASIAANDQAVVVDDYTASNYSRDGVTWANLNAADVAADYAGTSTANVDTDSVLLVQDAAGTGQYKAFHLSSAANSEDFNVELLGILDFGETQTFDAANFA